MHASFTAALAELLRAELAGYGGLLALFDRQQGALLRRDAQAVADHSREIETLAAETVAARHEREHRVSLLAVEHARPADVSLSRLLDIFPVDQRPLFQALIDEINRLIQVIRRRSRQNHAMLSRAVEIHQEIISTIRPGAVPPRTYSAAGRRSSLSPSAANTLQATG